MSRRVVCSLSVFVNEKEKSVFLQFAVQRRCVGRSEEEFVIEFQNKKTQNLAR